MKKLLSAAMALMFVLLLAGCGEKSKPEQNVIKFCDEMKTLQFKETNSYFASDDVNIEGSIDIGLNSDDDFTKRTAEFLRDNASKMTYTVGEVTVDGDKAEVPVTFTFVDASPVVTEALKEFVNKLYDIDVESMDDDEIMDIYNQTFLDKTATVETETTTTFVKFPCVKVDGEWKIGDLTEDDWYEIENVLCCNISKTTDAISQGLNEMME